MKPLAKIIIVAGILGLVASIVSAEELADRFSAHTVNSNRSVDHEIWDDLLDRYLDDNHSSGINRFDYKAVNRGDSARLDDYLKSLEESDVDRLSRDEQMAYWINFYNALTVRVILDNYPVDSIRDISRPWKTKLVTVAGIDLSLDDIEHEILRPIWKDERIHYAVNCASIGCPNLAGAAYTAANLEQMLEGAARDYINHERGVVLDGRRLKLSSIYNWYKEDFGNRQELYSHLLEYADTSTAADIRGASGAPRYHYDWDLNEP